jgi:hypothetical protein
MGRHRDREQSCLWQWPNGRSGGRRPRVGRDRGSHLDTPQRADPTLVADVYPGLSSWPIRSCAELLNMPSCRLFRGRFDSGAFCRIRAAARKARRPLPAVTRSVPDTANSPIAGRPYLQGYSANTRAFVWATAAQTSDLPRLSRQHELPICRAVSSGSDGTRTRDLRRDRLVPEKRRLATTNAQSLY